MNENKVAIKGNRSKYFLYYSLALGFIFVVSVILFFTLPLPNIIFGNGDPLAIIGLVFWWIVLQISGFLVFLMFRIAKNPWLGFILSLLVIIGFMVFIRFWFFSGHP